MLPYTSRIEIKKDQLYIYEIETGTNEEVLTSILKLERLKEVRISPPKKCYGKGLHTSLAVYIILEGDDEYSIISNSNYKTRDMLNVITEYLTLIPSREEQ